jgi:hypothetical protein
MGEGVFEVGDGEAHCTSAMYGVVADDSMVDRDGVWDLVHGRRKLLAVLVFPVQLGGDQWPGNGLVEEGEEYQGRWRRSRNNASWCLAINGEVFRDMQKLLLRVEEAGVFVWKIQKGRVGVEKERRQLILSLWKGGSPWQQRFTLFLACVGLWVHFGNGLPVTGGTCKHLDCRGPLRYQKEKTWRR